MRFDRWQIPLLVTGVIFCVGAYCRYPADTSEAVAAWVQGLGSLLAIGAAVWIYAKQYHDKRTDELAETRAFVQSIHTELSPLWNDWNLNFKVALEASREERRGFIVHVFPITADSLIP
jgi:hypothetical protein